VLFERIYRRGGVAQRIVQLGPGRGSEASSLVAGPQSIVEVAVVAVACRRVGERAAHALTLLLQLGGKPVEGTKRLPHTLGVEADAVVGSKAHGGLIG